MHKSDFNPDIFIKKIDTSLQWEDLVLPDYVLQGLEEITNYIQHRKKLKNNFQFERKIKPGFKVLFTGPPGTGKKLSTCLLGKSYDLDVYKVDLSQVVSKNLGETEKNLSRVFDMAESKNWILFFDEADALFGKRSSISDAHDRYANKDVSFFLQRIEEFDGLVILCSNFKKIIDEAFFRRFQLVIDFQIPYANQRYILWQKSKTDEFVYDEAIDLEYLAENFELSPKSIVNVLNYCIFKCQGRNDRIISLDDIMTGIKVENLAQSNAEDYRIETDINLTSKQEKHLPHEAWQVVQKKQGRAKPTIHIKDNFTVCDNKELTKIKILAYSDSKYLKEIGFYDVYSSSHSKTQNEVGTDYFSIVLVFDGTGIINQEPVEFQIRKLQNIAYKYDGATHEPNYLGIYLETKLLFKGRLTSFNVNHFLIDKDGAPLRSEVELKLKS